MKREYKTSVYLWYSNASMRLKKSDVKNKISISSEPKRIKFFDDENIKNIYRGLLHTGLITEFLVMVETLVLLHLLK